MANKVLATGSTGFLGTILKAEIRKSGGELYDINDLVGKFVDITHPFSIPEKGHQFDLALHIAGKAHSVPRTPEEEKVFYDVNYQGTINLCKAIDSLTVLPRALIFISTVAVYGIDSGVMIKEDHPLNGTTPYAKSKIMAEEYLTQWAGKNNIVLGILRLPLISGPNPPGNLGAMINGIKRGRYLSVGKADAQKSIVWAADIASIFHRLSEVGGTYNLTDGYNPTFAELEQEISRSLNKSKPLKIPMILAKLMAKVGDVIGKKAPINSDKLKKITSTLTFDDQKAVNALNWNPTKVLEKIVNAMQDKDSMQ